MEENGFQESLDQTTKLFRCFVTIGRYSRTVWVDIGDGVKFNLLRILHKINNPS
jgi:hypothetical protein